MVTWLASYPRSGNTWLRSILAMLLRPECATAVDIDQVVPFAADAAYIESVLGVSLSHVSLAVLRQAAARRMTATVVKIHDSWSPQVAPAEQTRGAVYIVRDPRDVALSSAPFFRLPLHEVVTQMARPLCGRGTGQLAQQLNSWSRNVVSWCLEAPFPVLRVRYETLRRWPVRTVLTIAAWLGIPTTCEAVRAVLRRTRVPRLRTVFPHEVRHGIVGGWRSAMPPELATAIVQSQGAVMRWCGYDS